MIEFFQSIEITINPQKMEYVEGDTFDPAGMILTFNYENGTMVTVSDRSENSRSFSIRTLTNGIKMTTGECKS